MKKVAMSLLGFAFAVLGAQASAVELGPITDPLEIDDRVFFDSFDVDNSGMFTDTLTFTLATDAIVAISIDNLPIDLLGEMVFNIEGLQATLFDSSGMSLGSIIGDGQSGDLILANSLEIYTLQITGNGTGTEGGVYAGIVAVSAIPIPAAGLLFFSGIAALGLVRSKRASA
ncbi:MAG: FxDxF family PEP-CTERM protein [Pseudomonadales bacterium]